MKRTDNILAYLKDVNLDWNVLDLHWACGKYGTSIILLNLKSEFAKKCLDPLRSMGRFNNAEEKKKLD